LRPRDRHLVMFVKAPRLGRVKTRLARDIGGVAAWAFYRRMVSDLARRLSVDGRWRSWLAISPDGALWDGHRWPTTCDLVSQGSGDLGDRMGRVAAVLPTGPVVIIGADVPGITPGHIDQAFRALGGHDAVFGPSPDGGYWLVGLRRRPSFHDPFQGVRWSSPDALSDTRANCPAGWRLAELEMLEDVDDGPSYRRRQRQS